GHTEFREPLSGSALVDAPAKNDEPRARRALRETGKSLDCEVRALPGFVEAHGGQHEEFAARALLPFGADGGLLARPIACLVDREGQIETVAEPVARGVRQRDRVRHKDRVGLAQGLLGEPPSCITPRRVEPDVAAALSNNERLTGEGTEREALRHQQAVIPLY